MKKKKTVAVVLLLAAVSAGIYFWQKKKQSANGQDQYLTATVKRGILTSSVSASGSTFVDQLSTVDPAIGGTVSNLSVKVGDEVEKGQLLFTIENDDLALNVGQAQENYQAALNALEIARAGKEQAEADYDAAKSVGGGEADYANDQLGVLEGKVDLAQDAIDQAQVSLYNAMLALRNEQNNAAKRNVTAPISGTINEVNIKNGDDLGRLLASGNTAGAPVVIGDLSTQKAAVMVNEMDVSRVSIGQKATLNLDALDSIIVTGKVEKIYSLGSVSQGVVSYNVIVSFDKLDERIKPQMTVSASIITDVREDVLIVPSNAVKTEGNVSYVEVLANNGPEVKIVRTGISNDTETEILDGLGEGETVITQTINPTED